MKKPENLDFLFHPRTIAIAGVSDKANKFNFGLKYLEGLTQFGFTGKIYPMNPTGGEIKGMAIYKNLKDIPDKIDFIISAIPAAYTPQLVDEASEKGVKAIHFFTSGFSEIENDEGKRLQADIITRAKKGGIRLIGPNCLGLYCPAGGLSFNGDYEKTSGSVAMISQSGGNAAHCIQDGASRGVYFSKVISMGNGADLNESDFLDYLAQDEETKIITAYIEGTRQGTRFFKALKTAAAKKPTIILKVGTSESGAEAAVSHTTAMAGSDRVWEGVLAQAGAIRAGSIEEMMDIALTFERMPAPAGNRIAIVGIGGGASVLLADAFSHAGLILPRLSDGLRQRLIDVFSTEAGRIFKNPIDLNHFETPEKFFQILNTLDRSDEIDMQIIHVAFDHFGLISNEEKELWVATLLALIVQAKKDITKPLAVILHSYSSAAMNALAQKAIKELALAGIAVFPSISRAAQALSKFAAYHTRRKG
ncbi:MAG: CoA-binding protein [Smithellaceae bacterium]